LEHQKFVEVTELTFAVRVIPELFCFARVGIAFALFANCFERGHDTHPGCNLNQFTLWVAGFRFEFAATCLGPAVGFVGIDRYLGCGWQFSGIGTRTSQTGRGGIFVKPALGINRVDVVGRVVIGLDLLTGRVLEIAIIKEMRCSHTSNK